MFAHNGTLRAFASALRLESAIAIRTASTPLRPTRSAARSVRRALPRGPGRARPDFVQLGNELGQDGVFNSCGPTRSTCSALRRQFIAHHPQRAVRRGDARRRGRARQLRRRHARAADARMAVIATEPFDARRAVAQGHSRHVWHSVPASCSPRSKAGGRTETVCRQAPFEARVRERKHSALLWTHNQGKLRSDGAVAPRTPMLQRVTLRPSAIDRKS